MNEYSDVEDLIADVHDRVETFVRSNTTRVEAKALGLDPRSGWNLLVDKYKTYIIVDKQHVGSLDYYGGFEYVDKECRQIMGDYVFFSNNDSRVEEHLDHLSDEETVIDEA